MKTVPNKGISALGLLTYIKFLKTAHILITIQHKYIILRVQQ